jgi:nucleoside-triphosphatase THEP1
MGMIIKKLFKKEIDRPIQGVVTIGNEDEEQKWQELEEYVCTDEIVKSFRTFFHKYRESLTVPTEKMGVWITGFFGSGKSHFLKILGYILENEEVAGVRASEYFKDKIKDQFVLADIRQSAKANNLVVLFNIDSKAKSDSKSKTQAIMDIMIRAFNEAVGYCGASPWVADLERTLDEEGKLEEFAETFEQVSGRNWAQTRAKALLNRDSMIKALVAVREMSEESAKIFIEDQIRNFTNATEDFGKIVNTYCEKHNSRVVFLMDEVGQFIGDSAQLMLNLQTCVEDLGKFAHGKAWVVITSQQELKAMIDSTRDKQHDFSKIQGRFNTRLLLSGADADEVIKRRILDKKENAETPLRALYDANASRLSQVILFPAKPTWSGYKDADEFKDVYPFVSYQFELLQKVFESIREHGMSEGKHISQNERSLLDAFQTSAKNVMKEESGLLVPFDSFYATAEEFIDYDIKTVFTNAARKPSLDAFDIRVLRILFMIRYVKDMPATIDRLATLMVNNINADKGALKASILVSLQRLEAETLIQKNGDEYDFLTNEEQDVNKQINNSAYNEGEVQRTALDIIFDKILENNKYRYEGRYDFALNRFVDSESKGSFSQDGLTIRVRTQFSGSKDASDYQSESLRDNAIIIDLTEGTFIDELIRANKIATFRRNNSATMSASLAEIMSKKASEMSDRIRRAEDMIRTALTTAPIYLGGSFFDIKKKDGKERLQDALKEMVVRDYFKIGLVNYFYPDQKSIFNLLAESDLVFGDNLSGDSNKAAYDEILEKIQDDKNVYRNTTVKSLLEHFSKKPYGWRDLDILGMIARLWKCQSLIISIHDHVVDESNTGFKNDLARKNNIDTMVVRPKEIIDETVLYQVKRIMNDIYAENLPLDEALLKSGVMEFFEKKKLFLSDLKKKYGGDYAGSKVAAKLYQDFSAILKSSDSLPIFNEIINRADSLEDNVEILDQLEGFYKEGSHQQKNYQDALELIEWYNDNRKFEDLSCLDSVIEAMQAIVNLEMPFQKMNDLVNLVFKASELRDQVLQDKYQSTVRRLEQDRKSISHELEDVMALKLTDDRRSRIQDKADELFAQYDEWLSSLLKSTPNMDSYIRASSSAVSGFREFIASVMRKDTSTTVRSKRVSIIECVPAVSKKVTSADDVEKVLDAIRTKLLAELENNDEVNLH